MGIQALLLRKRRDMELCDILLVPGYIQPEPGKEGENLNESNQWDNYVSNMINATKESHRRRFPAPRPNSGIARSWTPMGNGQHCKV